MTTPELPALITTVFSFTEIGEKISLMYDAESVEARERILQARIAELEEEADRRTREVEATYPVQARLNARIAELEADAERWRWIRKRNELTSEVDPRGPYCVEDDDGDTHYPTGAQLDAAIDAARSAP